MSGFLAEAAAGVAGVHLPPAPSTLGSGPAYSSDSAISSPTSSTNGLGHSVGLPVLSHTPSQKRSNSADSSDSNSDVNHTPGYHASPDSNELEGGDATSPTPPAFQDSLSAWLERSRQQMRIKQQQQQQQQQPQNGSPNILPLTRASTATASLSPWTSLRSLQMPLSKHLVSTPPTTDRERAAYSFRIEHFKGKADLIQQQQLGRSRSVSNSSSPTTGPASLLTATASAVADFLAMQNKPNGPIGKIITPASPSSTNRRITHNNSASSSSPVPTNAFLSTLPPPKSITPVLLRSDSPSPNPAAVRPMTRTPDRSCNMTPERHHNKSTEKITDDTSLCSSNSSVQVHDPFRTPPSQKRQLVQPSTVTLPTDDEKKLESKRTPSPMPFCTPIETGLHKKTPSLVMQPHATTTIHSPTTPTPAAAADAANPSGDNTTPAPLLSPLQQRAAAASGRSRSRGALAPLTHSSPPVVELTPPSLHLSPKPNGDGGSHRRSPSAHLPSQRGIFANGIGAALSAQALPQQPSTAHPRNEHKPTRLARPSISSPPSAHNHLAPMSALSPGPAVGGGSSSSGGFGGRADSLESAWRRKIVLNMNLAPHSAHAQQQPQQQSQQPDSGNSHRSPLSSGPGTAGGSAGSARGKRQKGPQSQPQTPTPTHATININTINGNTNTNVGLGALSVNGLVSHEFAFPLSSTGRNSARHSLSKGNGGVDSNPVVGTRNPSGSLSSSSSSSSSISPLTAQSNAVLGAMPVLARLPSDSTKRLRERTSSATHQPATNETNGGAGETSDENPNNGILVSDAHTADDQQPDWSSLCRCLTGEDLDACEQDIREYMAIYRAPSNTAGNASGHPPPSIIESLEDSIQDMEARKAITMRVRKAGWVVAFAFALAAFGSFGLLIGSNEPYVPIGGIFYIFGAIFLAITSPIIGRQTRWFKHLPLFELRTLHISLHIGAGMTALVLFIGSLEFHGSRGGLPSEPNVSTTDGWSRWIMCSIPVFIGYLLHDLHTYLATIWCAIIAILLLASHVINEFAIGSFRDHYPSTQGISRSNQWYLELCIQWMYLILNLVFAHLAALSIQSHAVQLWHRERFMLEQGKFLAAQREAAFSTANQKSNFLANMSHEIRTPLNSVLGLCSLVLESELTHDQRDCLTTVIKSGETLLCIINDILLFSKLESGELLIEELPFNPMNAIEDVIDIFALLAQQQENELIAHFKPGIICPVWGDVMRLRQVLTNLVSNALKFSTKGGEVIVTAEPYTPTESERMMIDDPPNVDPSSSHTRPTVTVDDGGYMYLKFSVQDFGCGIPHSKQHRLFHAFSQVDASDTRKYGGTGLGLVICQRLVELMRGRIGFESEHGRGSTFWFWIRLQTRPSQQQQQQRQSHPQTMQIQKTPPIETNHLQQQQLPPSDSSTDANTTIVQIDDAADQTQIHHETIDLQATPKPALQVDIVSDSALRTTSHGEPPAPIVCIPVVPQSIGSISTATVAPPALSHPSHQLSPSHVFNPSQGFLKYSPKLVGKRLLIVDQPRSAAAIEELAIMWGMQVTRIHTSEAWSKEWQSIVYHTQSSMGLHVTPMSSDLHVGSSEFSGAQSCRADRSTFSYASIQRDEGRESAPPTCTSAQAESKPRDHRPCKYDIILVLDSLLVDPNFAPYSSFNKSILADRLTLPTPTITTLQRESTPMTTLVAGPSQLLAALSGPDVATSTDVMTPAAASTCSTTHVTPTNTRRLSISDLPVSDELDLAGLAGSNVASSVCMAGDVGAVSGGGVTLPAMPHGVTPIATSLNEGIANNNQSGFDFNTSAPNAQAGLDGRSLFSMMSSSSSSVSSSTTPSATSPSSPAAAPGPTVILPSFVMLLSQTQRHARLDAAKEASSRGFAGVVMKPTKWKNLFQALLKAVKYRPSNTALQKAALLLGSTPPPPVVSKVDSVIATAIAAAASLSKKMPHTPTAAAAAAVTPSPPSSVLTIRPSTCSSATSPVIHSPPSFGLTSVTEVDGSLEHSSNSFRSGDTSMPESLCASPVLLPTGASDGVGPNLYPAASSIPDVGSAIGSFSFFRSSAHKRAVSDLVLPVALTNSLIDRGCAITPITDGGTSAAETPMAMTMPQSVRQASGPIISASSSSTHSEPNSNFNSASSTPLSHSPVFSSSSRLNGPFSGSVVSSIPLCVSSGVSASALGGAPSSVSRRAASKKAPAASVGPPNPNLRILIAEDNIVNQKVVLRMLKHLGYNDVTITNDGIECLQAMAKVNHHGPQSHSASKPFDLILMDIAMPRLGGISATKRIRSRICPQFQPKIVALTANVLPADQIACVEAGMNNFIAKPILLPQLRSMLEACESLQVTPIDAAATPPAVNTHTTMLTQTIASPTLTVPIQSPDSSQPDFSSNPSPHLVGQEHASESIVTSVESMSALPPLPCTCVTLWHPDEGEEEE